MKCEKKRYLFLMVIFLNTGLFSLGNREAWAQVLPPQASSTMSNAEFHRWMQSNGYSHPKTTTTTTTTTTVNANVPLTISGEPLPPVSRPNRRSRVISPPVTYEQGRQSMLNSVPALPKPSQDASIAFSELLQQNMPLTPQQVVALRQHIDLSQRAAAVPANIPPKPVSSTLMVNLAPGTTPPAIRLAEGYVSSLVFVDSTGAPWPIAAFDIGNPKSVNIQWDGKGNIIIIQAISAYGNGDMVVRLVGLPTPITLEIVAGQRVVDYRVDIHVPGIGPNTKELPIGTTLPESANQLLLGVLDGIAPAGSRVLQVIGADALAWVLGEKMYLRTRFTLLSPGWVATMVSPDGMHAYELQKTSSILVSRYGEPVELRIEGF